MFLKRWDNFIFYYNYIHDKISNMIKWSKWLQILYGDSITLGILRFWFATLIHTARYKIPKKTALTSGANTLRPLRKYFIRHDKVTTLFRGFPAKTNEVLRQSGKSRAQIAFPRLSSTWIRVAGLKFEKKQRKARGLARPAQMSPGLMISSLHFDWFRYFVSTVTKYLLYFYFCFAVLTKCFYFHVFWVINLSS